jgi:hypothetical protein
MLYLVLDFSILRGWSLLKGVTKVIGHELIDGYPTVVQQVGPLELDGESHQRARRDTIMVSVINNYKNNISLV